MGREEGREVGREEEKVKFVTKLVTQSSLPDEQIADIVGVPLSFVKSIRDRLNK